MNNIWGKNWFLKFRWLIFFSGAIFISSCVPDKELGYLNDQNKDLNRRVTKLEGTIDKKLGADFDSRLKSIHSSQAESGAEIGQLKVKCLRYPGVLKIMN
jgi:hypothetical protein